MNISVITGSRADAGLLEWPLKLLREDAYFSVAEVRIWGQSASQALQAVGEYLSDAFPDIVLLLGDRFEIMAAAMAAHLKRVPIAHIAGGDVTEGSYDDAMRDCISRMATFHFVTSDASMERLRRFGYTNIHLVGNIALDFILRGDWRRERPIDEPYVVVNYQPETIDGTVDMDAIISAVGDRRAFCLLPNPDAGWEKVAAAAPASWECSHGLDRAAYLNLIAHCEELIGNSSSMLYEAPALGVKCRMIGKRQHGRVAPLGDGRASNRIIEILKAHGQAAH